MSAAAPEISLPPLREDIRLLPGPRDRDGAPTWSLYDPALHRYLRIGRLEFEILLRWGLGRARAIARAVAAATPLPATEADVMEVLRFAHRGRLLQAIGPAAARDLAAEAAALHLSPLKWLLRNYLFFRIRLINPDRFLAAVAARAGFVFTPGFVVALLGLAALALYLVGRQWEEFTHSFLHIFSLEGAFHVGLALAFAKAVHEFGHGLVARRLGCRVSGMGFALLVMLPMLWTDTTDAWRLTDRRQRMLIDAAGVMAEMTLAVLAALAWCVLPDGPTRTAAFMLASSTWLVSLAINASPLMRFDGYYFLSDLLNEPNLQPRSFALARWWLREKLFGFGAPVPEALPDGRRRLLTAYAFACWLYRFFLFLGIALLVYHLVFKLLGAILLCVELGWFLARPIVLELRSWAMGLHRRGMTWRSAATMLLGGLLLAAAAWPWNGTVRAPGVLHAGREVAVLTPEAGRLVRVAAEGTAVASGQTLFVIDNPDTTYDIAAARAEIEGLRQRLAGQAFDAASAQDLPLAWQQLGSAFARLAEAQTRAAQMTMAAPFAGRLVDVPRDVGPGTWLPRREVMGRLVDPATHEAVAMVDEADIARIRPGAEAWFWPESAGDPIALTVRAVSPTAATVIDIPELESVHGGGVAVRRGADGQARPEAAVYRVTLAPADGAAAAEIPFGVRRGNVRIAAGRHSLLAGWWRRAVAVVVREAGL